MAAKVDFVNSYFFNLNRFRHDVYKFATTCSGDSSTFVDETLRNLTCSSRVALQGNSHDQKAEGKSIRKINRTDHKHARSGESKEVYKTSSLINSTKSSASSAATDTDITLNGVSSGSENRGNGTDNSVGKEDHRIGKLSSGESTEATDRLHNHIRKSPLITSHDTEMQGEASEFSLHQSTASGIYEHSCTYDNSNDDDDKIDTVNISIESSVARNNDRRNMRDSGYYNAKSQQISQSSMDQKEPLLYERRKRFMQPTSIYSDTVGDSGDNDAERISTSEPIRNPSGRVMEYSEVRKINIQVDKGYFFR